METRTAFFYKFLVSPRKIGSITPSSAYLTRKMLAGVDWQAVNSIVELGAGTGTFTKYIAAHKRPDCPALIVEQDQEMRRRLALLYPGLRYGSQAEKLPQLLQEHQLTGVDCLISGLPFAAFPASLRNQILRCAYEALNPGGQFIAFQYTPLLYPYLKRQYRQVRLGFEPRNLPPAFVFTCTK